MRTKKLYRVEIKLDLMVKARDEREALEIAYDHAAHEAAQTVHPRKVTEVKTRDGVTRNWSLTNPSAGYEREPRDEPQWSIQEYLDSNAD